MEHKEKSCCLETKRNSGKGILSGLLSGLIPHFFCIAFAVFSIIGAATATTFLKKFLLIPNFFYFLIAISLLLATISSAVYLRKTDCLCPSGIKNKWKYISTLYSATILINLLMFFIVLPALANMNSQKESKENASSPEVIGRENNLSRLSIDVEIPCSGHASLIIDEIKKNCFVDYVKFSMPNKFEIKYDPSKTTPEKIASLEIFKTYPAKIN